MSIGRAVFADSRPSSRCGTRPPASSDSTTSMRCSSLSEAGEEQVLKLFDELDGLTREPYRQAKAEIDAALAKNCGIPVDELRPWHYHNVYFSEVPAVLGDLPEAIYKPIETLKVCREFYGGIGLPIDDVLKRSSLYEQPGKCPHLRDRHRPHGQRRPASW